MYNIDGYRFVEIHRTEKKLEGALEFSLKAINTAKGDLTLH